jgi:hydroxymethylpyrimidine/phosphomethylpyrimidine kinase|tara:strand:+ start:122 stop:883 length:762 start_codon:yes stop_codon:yes gene_type:complete
MNKKKVILSISAHDPTGGAGLQSDILTSSLYNHHCVSALTGQTVQTTKKLLKKSSSKPDIFLTNLKNLSKDFKIDGIKVGALWSPEINRALIKFLKKIDVPIVIDTIVSAGGGGNFILKKNLSDFVKNLYPLANLITPNNHELKAISGCKSLDKAIKKLLELNINKVYITGNIHDGEVINYLYINGEKKLETKSNFLNKEVHGTGCALSTSILCNLVNGSSLEKACIESHKLLYGLVQNSTKTSDQNIIDFSI